MIGYKNYQKYDFKKSAIAHCYRSNNHTSFLTLSLFGQVLYVQSHKKMKSAELNPRKDT